MKKFDLFIDEREIVFRTCLKKETTTDYKYSPICSLPNYIVFEDGLDTEEWPLIPMISHSIFHIKNLTL